MGGAWKLAQANIGLGQADGSPVARHRDQVHCFNQPVVRSQSEIQQLTLSVPIDGHLGVVKQKVVVVLGRTLRGTQISGECDYTAYHHRLCNESIRPYQQPNEYILNAIGSPRHPIAMDRFYGLVLLGWLVKMKKEIARK